QQWDPNASAVVRDTSYSFYNVFDFNAAISLSTKVYGFFKPFKFLGKLSEKLQMVRHVMTPTISFSASPDFGSPFWGYYGNYEYVDATGKRRTQRYSYFQHGVYGSAPNTKSGTIMFNIANNLEAKIKSDNDSTGFKKISLIENFTLSQSCNLAADSMKWSNLNTSIMLRLTKGFNLNLSATWDVYKYALNEAGNPVRINKLRLFNGGGWGRLSSTGTSFSYTFNNDTFKRKGNKDKDKKNEDPKLRGQLNRNNDEEGEEQEGTGPTTDLELIDGYAKWDCPWSLTVNYSLSYGYGSFNYDKLEYNGRWTQNLSLNANIRPTKNWSLTASASYNFDTHKIAYMNCSISRQMHCFEMSASFVPVGPYKSYNFHIAVKSSILQDVKYDKHSSINNGVTWY
ncbi:MAG: LPS-assembly protein LptD, partial [Muribaculaceae bacterium]|nr:LPS-assembly protein LptD [Muribaculaceae bacterium]